MNIDKLIQRTALLVGFLLIAGVAMAQTAPWNTNTIAWNAPTLCENGSPIATCPVSGYIVERSALTDGNYAQVGTVAANVLTYTHNLALAGQNCYRVIATAAPPLVNSFPSLTICKTNVAPPTGPAPPSNVRFVTVAAVTHSSINATPVATILGSAAVPTGGSIVGLVPLNRVTQSAPLFTMLGKQWCRVEVASKEVFIASRSLANLAAPCAARA